MEYANKPSFDGSQDDFTLDAVVDVDAVEAVCGGDQRTRAFLDDKLLASMGQWAMTVSVDDVADHQLVDVHLPGPVPAPSTKSWYSLLFIWHLIILLTCHSCCFFIVLFIV